MSGERWPTEIDLERGERQRLPLIEIDPDRTEQTPHTRSRAEMKSDATRATSRTPVRRLNASSRVRGARRVPDVLGGAVDDLPAFVDDDDASAHALDDVEDVGTEKNRAALARKLLQDLLHYHRGVGIEAVERLIEEDHLRPVNECRCDEHLLSHTLGVLAQPLVLIARKPEQIEQLASSGVPGLSIEVVQACDDLEVLRGRQAVVECRGLRDITEAFLGLERLVDDIEPCDHGAAAGRSDHAREDSYRGGLACSVRSQKSEDLARLDAQVQVRQRDFVGVFAGQLLGQDHAVDECILWPDWAR